MKSQLRKVICIVMCAAVLFAGSAMAVFGTVTFAGGPSEAALNELSVALQNTVNANAVHSYYKVSVPESAFYSSENTDFAYKNEAGEWYKALVDVTDDGCIMAVAESLVKCVNELRAATLNADPSSEVNLNPWDVSLDIYNRLPDDKGIKSEDVLNLMRDILYWEHYGSAGANFVIDGGCTNVNSLITNPNYPIGPLAAVNGTHLAMIKLSDINNKAAEGASMATVTDYVYSTSQKVTGNVGGTDKYAYCMASDIAVSSRDMEVSAILAGFENYRCGAGDAGASVGDMVKWFSPKLLNMTIDEIKVMPDYQNTRDKSVSYCDCLIAVNNNAAFANAFEKVLASNPDTAQTKPADFIRDVTIFTGMIANPEQYAEGRLYVSEAQNTRDSGWSDPATASDLNAKLKSVQEMDACVVRGLEAEFELSISELQQSAEEASVSGNWGSVFGNPGLVIFIIAVFALILLAIIIVVRKNKAAGK